MLKAVRTALTAAPLADRPAPRVGRAAKLVASAVALLSLGTVLAAGPASAATLTSPDAAPAVHHTSTHLTHAQTAYAAQVAFGEGVLSEAARHDGAPYSYGSSGPYAFDCSGFTSYVYRQMGVYIPRTSYSQYAYVEHISRAAALPGDLVFMSGLGHVGIYAGHGMMWDAPTSGQQVHLRPIYDGGYLVGRVRR